MHAAVAELSVRAERKDESSRPTTLADLGITPPVGAEEETKEMESFSEEALEAIAAESLK